MVETIHIQHKSRRYAFLLTLFLMGGIFLLLVLYIIHTPDPPYPEGGGGAGTGIELNLGFSATGMGDEPDELAAAALKQSEPVKVKADDDKLLTQDVEDAPSLNEKIEKVKPKKKTPLVVTPVKKVEKKEPEKPKQVVNQKALYPAHGTHTSADGSDKTPGDKGDPSGTLASKAFGGQGGKGGSGGGDGGGNGPGKGPGNGPGISFNLANRKNMSLPKPDYRQQVEGTVVVEVTVNKEGEVTQAIPGVKGSTTLDEQLMDAAKRAAFQARFDRKPDAPAFQKGTITYKFRLQ